MFLRVARNPAFVMGYDRQTYQKLFNIRSGVFQYLDSIVPVIIIFPIIDYYNGYKKTGILGMVLYFSYYLWIGHKFGAFFSFITMFIMARYDAILEMRPKKLIRYIYIFLAVMLSIVFMTALLAINMYGGVLEDYLWGRVAGQGMLWWKTFEVSKETHLDEFHNEIDGIFIDNSNITDKVNANYGMYKIMYLCGNDRYVTARLKEGIVYTESGYASAYYYLGVAGGIIFAVFNAFVLVIVRNAILCSLRRSTLVRLIVIIRVYNIIIGAQSSFNFHSFVKTTSIIGWVILIAGALHDRSFKKSCHRNEALPQEQATI